MSRKHLGNLLRFPLLYSFFILLIAGCISRPGRGFSYNPIPLSTGQWAEYVTDSSEYDDFHVRFTILGLNENGILLETDYFAPDETLQIESFHNLKNNYLIDAFVVQYNSETPYKFIPPEGHFIFQSPIPNVFIWAAHIDTTNWKTIRISGKQFNVFKISLNEDTVYYSAEIPVFNVARMYLNGENLVVYNYGNKGGESLINSEAKILVTGEQLPSAFREMLAP